MEYLLLDLNFKSQDLRQKFNEEWGCRTLNGVSKGSLIRGPIKKSTFENGNTLLGSGIREQSNVVSQCLNLHLYLKRIYYRQKNYAKC